MSARRHLAVWLASCAGWALPCAADEKEPGWMVRVDVQMVSIPEQQALTLVPRLRDERTVQAAVATLQTMIAKKEATLMAWPVVWTPSGQKAVAETAEEKRYTADRDDGGGTPQAIGEPVTPPSRVFFLPHWSSLLRGAMPVSFETRSGGPMIEVEPAVSGDGRSVELNAVLRYVRFMGYDRFVTGKFSGGIENHTERPRFVETHTTSRFFVPAGRPILAGCFHFAGKEPHVELFILRATTRRAASPKP